MGNVQVSVPSSSGGPQGPPAPARRKIVYTKEPHKSGAPQFKRKRVTQNSLVINFDDDDDDEPLQGDLQSEVHQKVMHCPGAWPWPLLSRCLNHSVSHRCLGASSIDCVRAFAKDLVSQRV